MKKREKIMEYVFLLAAVISIVAVALICIFLFANGIPAMKKIGFVEFRELKYAIEALGGEYNEPRTFDGDEDFMKVEDQSAKEGFSEIGNLS